MSEFAMNPHPGTDAHAMCLRLEAILAVLREMRDAQSFPEPTRVMLAALSAAAPELLGIQLAAEHVPVAIDDSHHAQLISRNVPPMPA